MVLQKKLNHGFSAYQVPTTPRATRSTRRSATRQEILNDNQMSAFDLLATVAGKLLQDKEPSTTSSDTLSEKDQYGLVMEKSQTPNKPQKAEPSSLAYDQNCTLKEVAHPENDGLSGMASKVTNSSCSLLNGKSHNQMENLVSIVELDSSGSAEFRDCKFDNDICNVKDVQIGNVPIGMETEKCSFEDSMDEKSPALFSSGGNAKLSGSDDNIPCSTLSKDCDNLPLDSRDDDENCFSCTHPSTKAKSFRIMTRIGNRRIRKILASKNWKVSSESKDDKLLDRDPGMSSLEARQRTGLKCRDSHVKLRIKSFRVPELCIEIPETATIGSLKRTVMEAVTAILGGELDVGVILQGKKVRDDSKTLIQTGISHDNHLDALGFTLEPNSSKGLQPICAIDPPHVFHANMPRNPSTSSQSLVHQNIKCSSDRVPEHQVTILSNLVESDHDSALSAINTCGDKSMTDSKALVTVPETGMEALTVIPMHHKMKRSEVVQRRIRRPFSVAEVEALVQAVEKLGTGRWRDVKLCAFDNAEHRTYVDLKDKWKTLVHTARISPQQRRGQPVPQELLDRVLIAHHHWSNYQTK